MSDQDRFNLLLEHFLEGRLPVAERAELRQLMAADPALRSAYVEMLAQETAMRRLLAAELSDSARFEVPVETRAKGSGARPVIDLNAPDEEVIVQPTQKKRSASATSLPAVQKPLPAGKSGQRTATRGRRSRLSIWLRPALAFAAVLICGVYLAHWFTSGKGFHLTQSPVVGRVEDCSGSARVLRLGQAIPVAEGLEVRPGDRVLISGPDKLLVRCTDGTAVALQGETDLQFLNSTGEGEKARATLLRLAAGKFQAEVSPQPKDSPLTVETPHATVTVIGTRFSLLVSGTQTNLDVSEGSVQFQRGGESMKVEQGSAAVADSSGVRKATAIAAVEEPKYEDLMRTLSVAETSGDGAWSIRLSAEGPVLCQTNAACASAKISLSSPRWRQGLVTGQYRILKNTDEKNYGAQMQMVCQSRSGQKPESHLVPYMTGEADLQMGLWVNINTRFQISPEGKLYAQSVIDWFENAPGPIARVGTVPAKQALGDPSLTPTQPIEGVESFGLAIECRKASAEFRNLRLYFDPDAPQGAIENLIDQKIRSHSGSGVDLKNIWWGGDGGKWRVAQNASGLTVVQEEDARVPSLLNLGAFGGKVLLSGQVMLLPENAPVPAGVVPQTGVVSPPRTAIRLSMGSPMTRQTNRLDSPCMLLFPMTANLKDVYAQREMWLAHFCYKKEPGIPESGKWFEFRVYFDGTTPDKMVEGHAYWPEGARPWSVWCVRYPNDWKTNAAKQFSLNLYSYGQRLVWRNLKVVPY
ncbi:MAG TPA: FecR domain-containing protein [Planctomycetota bacterium]|jgi:anti-sigma factor RsiW